MKDYATLTLLPLIFFCTVPVIFCGYKEYTSIMCPDEYILINKFTCRLDTFFSIESKCKKACETSFGCMLDGDPECPSLPSCPGEYSVRCPDSSCVKFPSECNNFVSCPSYLPITCPNGDCRASLDDCPSSIYCSDPFGILCNDNSCRMSKDFCELPSLESKCVDKSLVRCPDGICQPSKFLCATPVTCPLDRVLTYKGLCKKPENRKNSEASCPEGYVLCNFDFSCAKDFASCPTGIICPMERPVKCWDSSCAATIGDCPAFQECPSGMIECADGSCASEGEEVCGTHITCSKDRPFRCFDNTCRANPDDCPATPRCPSTSPILCWDGRCISDRSECSPPSKCPDRAPIKGPDGLCKNLPNDCIATDECPYPFIRCNDGTCRKNEEDCEEEKCGVNFPYKCPNGMCALNQSHCENNNGCPYTKPVKCPDGSCASMLVCPKNETAAKKCFDCCVNHTKDGCVNHDINIEWMQEQLGIVESVKACADGSIRLVNETCPEANGCTPSRLNPHPLLCGDGTCINPLTETCPISKCPQESPYRCIDGKCVDTSSHCPPVNNIKINGTYLLCANGFVTENFEECKPLAPCNDYFCPDGSCRKQKEYCPAANDTCPSEVPYRCSDGTCKANENECTNKQGCPLISGSRCPTSGFCANKSIDCSRYEANFDKSNGCPAKTPFMCGSGKCVKSSVFCEEDNYCPIDLPYRCDNGLCYINKRECTKIRNKDCPYPCPFNKYFACGVDTLETCLNNFNCTLNKPFRCSDGTCKRYPVKKYGLDVEYDDDACPIGIRCPDSYPYLCANGECVAKKQFCPSFLLECPEDTPETCFDRTCAKNKAQCPNKCPAKYPILCSNGNCANKLYDCFQTSCPTETPIRCYSGRCEASPINCLKIIYFNLTTEIRTVCREDEVTCYDGSCRKSFDDCPLYEGCNNLANPFKCSNALCANSSTFCPESDEADLKCEGSLKMCEDGICRSECPDYNGCPFDKPLLCSNGKCVLNEDECAGESNCGSVETPFRCVDGTCKSKISECPSPIKNFGASNIKISSFINYDVSADIVSGENYLITASAYIPTGVLRTGTQDVDGQFHFKSVPQSKVRDSYTTYDTTRRLDIMRAFPYGDLDSTNRLSYEYCVLSPVIEIQTNSPEIEFKPDSSILLSMIYDFPEIESVHHSVETEEMKSLFMDLDGLRDVCLAKLNETTKLNVTTKEWFCCEDANPTIRKSDRYRLEAAVKKNGTYAVILYPQKNEIRLDVKVYTIIAYRIPIFVCTFIALVIIILAIYVFYRQYRYRGKYKEMKDLAEKYKIEMDEMINASTSILGQTFGDTKEGIVFTDNPAFKKQKDEALNKRVKQLESLYYSTHKNLKAAQNNNAALMARLEELKKNYESMKKLQGELANKNEEGVIQENAS